MHTAPLPTLYLSHGSPMIAVEDSPTQRFFKHLGPTLDACFGRPRAVIIMSPHSMSRTPMVLGAARHSTIHDFGGFPEALYAVQYNAPGDPVLAQRVSELLGHSGHPMPVVPEGGLDHGMWTPLMHLWPRADVPVVPVMLPALAGPVELLRAGQALAPLTHEQVLVIGSGSLTHNLHRVFGSAMPAVNAPEAGDCAAFRRWVHMQALDMNWPALLDWRAQAPHALAMHPTDEHWRPFYFAAGAAGSHPDARRIHADVEFGCLSMDAYAFGPSAAMLLQALNP